MVVNRSNTSLAPGAAMPCRLSGHMREAIPRASQSDVVHAAHCVSVKPLVLLHVTPR